MKRRLLFIIVLLCIANGIYAQSGLFDLLNKPMYEARVKLIDEFIARFNGIEKRNGVPDDYTDRKSNILMLFDLTKFKSKQDSLFMSANEFANKVLEENVQLNYTDSCWYAKVKCQGSIANRNVDFYLYLTVERRGENMYKWSIANAEGTVFDTSRTRKHRELFISPNDHEMSFMSLSKITDGSNRYIDDYAKDGYEADALSVFLTLVRCGQLKIKYVTDAEFFFLQVPGYIFSVKHFERESMNLGWLISSLEKCDNIKKAELLSSLRVSQIVSSNTSEDSLQNTEVELGRIDSSSKDTEMNQTEAEKVVEQFGTFLRLWIETEEFGYRERCIELCAGHDGRECLVNDSLMLKFANMMELPISDTYQLPSYITGFQSAMIQGLINSMQISEIRLVDMTNKHYIVSCNLVVSGKTTFVSRDLFYVRRNTNKISGIYSSVLSERF